jgi:hypothetical protein
LWKIALSKQIGQAYRILKPGGIIMIQDRTFADCQLPGSPDHIRGYFFENFPHLLEIEKRRRHEHNEVVHALLQTGFTRIRSQSLWETRKTYSSFDPFAPMKCETDPAGLFYMN